MKISAYTTTKDCIEGNYPFIEAIESALPIVDELIIFDSSRKNDGTLDALKSLSEHNKKIKLIHDETIDWSAPNHGIYDGIAKAMARKFCTGDVLIQFDVDEIFHEKDIKKWKDLCFEFSTGNIEVLHLPVIEFWGPSKIRIDIGPTKERITKNKLHITHGIPALLRFYNDNLLYSKQGSDGCNLINSDTFMPIQQFMPNIDFSFFLRQEALYDEESKETYERFYKKFIINNEKYPCIYHYSWFNISRKLKTYKNFWANSWASLYGENSQKTNPMFPDMLNEDITDDMITSYSLEIENKTGGWIFHKPWDGSFVFGLSVENTGATHPSYVSEWIKQKER